jgi:hypothetical protein
MDGHPRYRGLRLDDPAEQFHRVVDRRRANTVPAPPNHQPASPPSPRRRRQDPGDGQAALLEEAS